ncbi:hypothetical protein Trydic_g17724 [Trypoxylus dichotomus]
MRLIILFTVFFVVARSNVIPSNHLNSNSSNRISKKRENYHVWVNNNEPLKVCPAVQASLAPAIKSRMCSSLLDDEENLGEYFITVGDVQGQTIWLKDKENHKNSIVKNRSFDDVSGESSENILIPVKKEVVWTYNNSPAPHEDPERFLVGYLNSADVVDVLQEPTDGDLEVFFRVDDLPNIDVPMEVTQKAETENSVIVEAVTPQQENDTQTQADLENYYETTTNIIPSATTNNENDILSTPEFPIIEDTLSTTATQSVATTEITTSISESQVPKETESKNAREESNGGEFERTNQIMNEILLKLKQVEDFQQIQDTLQKFVGDIKSGILLKSGIDEQVSDSKGNGTVTTISL